MDATKKERMKAFGLLFTSLLKERGVSPKDMALTLNISRSYLSRIGTGQSCPGDDLSFAFGVYLKVDPRILVRESRRARWEPDTFCALYQQEIAVQGIDPLAAVLLSRVRDVSTSLSTDMRTLMFRAIHTMLDFAERE